MLPRVVRNIQDNPAGVAARYFDRRSFWDGEYPLQVLMSLLDREYRALCGSITGGGA